MQLFIHVDLQVGSFAKRWHLLNRILTVNLIDFVINSSCNSLKSYLSECIVVGKSNSLSFIFLDRSGKNCVANSDGRIEDVDWRNSWTWLNHCLVTRNNE